MAIQTDNLVMAALGVVNDQPLNPIQPRLEDGIHLRFGFAPDRGFPWHGYYLFRRPHSASDRQCLQPKFSRDWKPGTWPSLVAGFTGGMFRSDTELLFLDQFPPAASPEFDLRSRKYLRFELPAGERAREFHVKLGMLGGKGPNPPAPTKKCVTFTGLKLGLYPNPYVSATVEFTASASNGTPAKSCEIRSIQGTAGLVCPGQLVVRLPVRTSSVEIDLIQSTASAEFVALGARQNLIDRKTASVREGKQTIQLAGSAIASVKITAPKSGTFVLRLCYATESPETPLLGPIKLRGFDGQVRVTETEVSGRAGDIVTAPLAADTLTSLEIEGGPAALIDICTVAISQDLARGWRPLMNQPLCLPVEHPDYPCPGKPATFVQAASLAQSRIHYGPAANWAGQNFADLHSILNDLVVHGPAGGVMADRTKSYSAPAADEPGMPKLHPLEVALLGSLNPAVAMMLGLYWIDSTAQPGAAYDYLIMADHAGQFHGDPMAALAALAAVTPQAPLSSDVDIWITFGKKLEAAPPLAPPAAPRVYALPGAITGSNAPASNLPLGGRNMAGLTWQINATPDGSLLPEAPIGYHLWRANLGSHQPSGPPPWSAYNLLTADRLIVATEAPSPSSVTPERASDWPPFPLKAFDPGLPDGWYSYCLSAVDIFGRHSSFGAPGEWLQWTWPPPKPSEPPAPKPWYYIDPPAERQINSFAVRLLDKSPPPRVPGVEADALDPDDKMLLRDAAYTNWWKAIEPDWWNPLGANQDNVLPLRVRWKWTAAQMLQAPDTKEFRIYFNPGTDPPAPDFTEPADWQQRIYVVDYGDHFNLGLDDDKLPVRLYEVLLPVPNEQPIFHGVPLAPSETDPIVYAHVSVSAADDKLHTADNPKWASSPLGNRPGNEGKVGTPAKIYRVLRSKPPAPAAVDDSDKVWATKADYHSRSYYTFRWAKSGTYKAHIFRALDDTLFQTDWERRQQGALPVDPTDVTAFPIPTWTQPTRDAIAAELNSLPVPSASAPFDQAARTAYGALSNNALRTLAGLPGNEAAFSQLTYLPLDSSDATYADHSGPDGPDAYTPNGSLCAYTAGLDGRATNRYFFRAAYVNAALTVGPLGPSSPAVYLPRIVPPRTPVITKILGGDKQIIINWASNREPDLAEYRIYRAETAEAARDIRVMSLIHVEAVTASEPSDRPQSISWTDTPLPGLTPFAYRVTVVDEAGNESTPSPMATCRATDTFPPAPATITGAFWIRLDAVGNELPFATAGLPGAVHVQWTGDAPGLEYLVQRRAGPNDLWGSSASWGPQLDVLDQAVDEASDYQYRILSRKPSNKLTSASAPIAATGK